MKTKSLMLIFSSFIVPILSVIGFIAICIVCISLYFGSHLGYGVEEFGSEDRLNELNTLYQTVLSKPNPEKQIPINNGFPITKKIPGDWIPEVFIEDEWKWGNRNTLPPYPGSSIVLAYYDESEKLIGIEFSTSRWGCFISDNPNVCPNSFGSLNRISSHPLYVSIWTIN